MADPRVEKLADVLVGYSVAVQPGDKVFINGGELAAPLLKALYARVLQAGGHPDLRVVLSGTEELFYRYASDEQLQYVPEPFKLITETYDVSVSVRSAANTKELSGVDPAIMVKHNRAMASLMQTFMKRSAAGDLRWTSTLFPTEVYAQDAGMSLSDYEHFVYGACMPDMDDPVGYWQRFSAWQQKIVDWFEGKEQVHVIGPETDLRLSVTGRTFINSDGKHNMPSARSLPGQ
jgi:aminopeptidase